MKPIHEQNFYELLDLKSDASRGQIEQAFQLAKKTYGTDSLAVYSLFDAGERREVLQKIDLAYDTLHDQDRRRRYDREVMGLEVRSETDSNRIDSLTPKITSGEGDPKSPEPSRVAAEPDIETLTGTTLREYRERRNIPLQEIADKTRVNINYFEYLEKDHYRSLPPAVYLRSYIVQYARMLGLDPERVADRVLALVEASRKAKEG